MEKTYNKLAGELAYDNAFNDGVKREGIK